MRIKEYEVTLKYATVDTPVFIVDAPNKRIARWCGANLYNHNYSSYKTARDMIAKPVKKTEDKQMILSVEDKMLEGLCDGCDQDPIQCWEKDFCIYEEEQKYEQNVRSTQ
jgi:hypothetical protein